jgi:tetratricopeptide (TPR) repeat protein
VQGRGRAWALPAALVALLAVVGVTRVLPRGGSAGDPAQAPSLYQVGMDRRQQGDLRGAADAFRRAVAVLPDWPAAHLQLGATYAEAREYELARRELERTVALAPEEAVAWGQLGKLQLVTRQLDEAERALQRAMRLQPDRASYPALLGEVYRQRGDPASTRKAVSFFRQALALQPEDADAYHRLGLAYQRLGQLGEAALALTAATRFAPAEAAPYLALSQVERSRGHEAEATRALSNFRRLQQSQPGDPRGPDADLRAPGTGGVEADAKSASADLGSGAPATALGARPATGAAGLIAAGRHTFYDLARPEEAVDLFRRAQQADPRDPDAAYNLGLVLHFLGRLPEAETAFRQAQALNPRNPRYHAWIGTLLLDRGPAQLDAAVAALRRAVELGPKYAYGHYQLGRAVLQQNRPAEAAALFEQTVALNPRYREAWYSLYQADARLGKQDAARRALATFQRLDAFRRERRQLATLVRNHPDDPAPHLRLARLLAKNDERKEAIRLLDSFMHAHPEDRTVQGELQSLRRAE